MEESKLKSKCYICEQEFSHYDLKAHFLECDQKHGCETCHKVFRTKHQLDNHKAVHDESKTSKIVLENPNKGNKVHKLVETAVIQPSLSSSNKSVKKNPDIKAALANADAKAKSKSHAKEYQCEKCFKTFSSKSNWTRHNRKIHGTSDQTNT